MMVIAVEGQTEQSNTSTCRRVEHEQMSVYIDWSGVMDGGGFPNGTRWESPNGEIIQP